MRQVGHLEEAYQDWVHQPIVSKEGPRFFESDFWEVKLSNDSVLNSPTNLYISYF